MVLIKQKRENLKTRHSLAAVKVELEPATTGCLFCTSVGLVGDRHPYPHYAGREGSWPDSDLVSG